MGDSPGATARQFAAADESTLRDLAEGTIRGRGQRVLAGSGTVQSAAGGSRARANRIAREAAFGLRAELNEAGSAAARRRLVNRALPGLDNDPALLHRLRNRGRQVLGQRQLAGG